MTFFPRDYQESRNREGGYLHGITSKNGENHENFHQPGQSVIE